MANTPKPITLNPLKLEDAVAGLLKVKPESRAPKTKKSVQKMDKS